MTKTEEQYADTLVKLMEANVAMELDPTLALVLTEVVVPHFQQQTVEQAMQVIGEGGEPVSTMLAIPSALSVMMFQLGVLYGRYEASELLGE